MGAGVFGVWTALELQCQGLNVLLVDAWGVGHARASSSGESRVIRIGYADRTLYSEWSLYSLDRWKALQSELERTLFLETGVLWLGGEQDNQIAATTRVFEKLQVAYEELTRSELQKRFPQLATQDIKQGLWEPGSGVLRARFACQQAAQHMVRQGGDFRLAAVKSPGKSRKGRLHALNMQQGPPLEADFFVFCCGPWLSELFPDLLASRIQVSRQEVFFFGLPAGDQSYLPGRLPAWIDLKSEIFYGLPAVGGRSLKLACDETGSVFDPTLGDRSPSPQELQRIRGYLAHRFPALRDAPLLESRVCQYSRSADSHLIVDRHPEWENVVLAGAGSGHGFKLAPAVGRLSSQLVSDPAAEAPREVKLSNGSNSQLPTHNSQPE